MNTQLTLALRYLRGHKTRTILTTLSIVLGVMLLFGMNGMLPAIKESFSQGVKASTSLEELTVTRLANGIFGQEQVALVRNVPGVVAATGSLSRKVILPTDMAPQDQRGQLITNLTLTGLDLDTFGEIKPLSLIAGRGLQPGDRAVALINQSLAENSGLWIGDQLTLPAADGVTRLEIVGIVADFGALSGGEPLYLPLDLAQQILNLPDQINVIEAMVAPGEDVAIVGQRVLESLGSGYQLGGVETGSEIQAVLELGDFIFSMFGIVALVMSGFIIFITFRTVVMERRRDVGMLRALGASRRTVTGIFLFESLLQGVVGTFLGLVAGYLFINWMLAVLEPMWRERLGLSLGGAQFSLGIFILSIILGVGIAVLAGLYPAVVAGRMTPMDALRPAISVERKGSTRRRAILGIVMIAASILCLLSRNVGLASLGVILFIAGLMILLPLLVRPVTRLIGGLLTLAFAREGNIAQGNLIRQPERAAITASVIAISLAVVLGVTGLLTTLTYGVFSYIDKSLGADFLFIPSSFALGSGNVAAGPELIAAIRQVPGVESATTLRSSFARFGETDVMVVGVDPQTYPQVSGLELSRGDEQLAYQAMAQGNIVLANGMLATQGKLDLGDDIELLTPAGMRTYTLQGIGNDYMNSKIMTLYISQDLLAKDFFETGDVLLMLNLAANADPAAVRAELDRLEAEYPGFTLYAAQEWKDRMVQDARTRMSITYLLVAVLALPSLIGLANTLGINVLERTREIGVLRAVGATRRQVQRIIMAESLLLAAIGIAFGILAGLWLGYVMTASMALVGYDLAYFFPWSGILLAVAVGLLIAVLAALHPARQASRLQIITALQYE